MAGIKDETGSRAARLEAAIEGVLKIMTTLIRRAQRSISISERRKPATCYQTRDGLWVHDRFRNLIVAKAQLIAAGTTFKFNEDELGENMADAQIEARLPTNHLWDESAAGAVAVELIESDQLVKGRSYRLYTASCVVGVGWGILIRSWYVDAWLRDSLTCHASTRVLSPTN